MYLAKQEEDSVIGSDVDDPEEDILEGSPTLKAEAIAHYIGNAAVLLLAALLLMVNMLAVPKYGTTYADRSDWFWFWIMPNPVSSPGGIQDGGVVYHRLLSQYPPLKYVAKYSAAAKVQLLICFMIAGYLSAYCKLIAEGRCGSSDHDSQRHFICTLFNAAASKPTSLT